MVPTLPVESNAEQSSKTETELCEAGLYAPECFRVGVRKNAFPFAAIRGDEDADTRAGHDLFEGFVFELCEFAFKALGWQEGVDYILIEADASTRLDGLKAETSPTTNSDRPEDQPKFHMVCDPTSMTVVRLGTYVFSPPVFISAGSYVSSNRALDKLYQSGLKKLDARRKLGGSVSSYNGERFEYDASLDAIQRRQSPPQQTISECDTLDKKHIIGARLGYVKETTGRALIEQAMAVNAGLGEDAELYVANFQTICAQGFETHDEAFKALCDEEITHHFGDRDIINAAARKLDPSSECDAAPADEQYSRELYAIAISPELEIARILEVQAAILQALGGYVTSANDQSSPVRVTHHLFGKYFGGSEQPQRMSVVLSNLFELY